MNPARLRFRRLGLAALGAFVFPPLLWAAFVTFVPTDCARRSIAERLSRSSGRPVSLGNVKVGFLGGVSLRDLTIGAPGSAATPWLRIDRASIDVSLRQLLVGTIEPRKVEVVGLNLRVLRRLDGTLELADFLAPVPREAGPEPDSASEPRTHGELEVVVKDGGVVVADESSGTKLEFEGVRARATCNGIVTRFTELHGTLNGGEFEAVAQVTRSGKGPAFEGQFRCVGVSIDPGMKALAYLTPVFAGMTSDVGGKLDLDLYLQGEGASRGEIGRTISGIGRINLDPLVLDGSRLLEQVGKMVELGPKGRVGAVRADLKVGNGRVASDNLVLDVAPAPVVLAGWTDFGGVVSYRLRTEAFRDRLPARARQLLTELALDGDDLPEVKVEGTLDALAVTVDGLPIDARGKVRPPLGDQDKLREIGRRLRDRVRR